MKKGDILHIFYTTGCGTKTYNGDFEVITYTNKIIKLKCVKKGFFGKYKEGEILNNTQGSCIRYNNTFTLYPRNWAGTPFYPVTEEEWAEYEK